MSFLEEVRGLVENLVSPKRFCKHGPWRAAITSRGAAKLCCACAMTFDISDAEFYALFGEAKFNQMRGHCKREVK